MPALLIQSVWTRETLPFVSSDATGNFLTSYLDYAEGHLSTLGWGRSPDMNEPTELQTVCLNIPEIHDNKRPFYTLRRVIQNFTHDSVWSPYIDQQWTYGFTTSATGWTLIVREVNQRKAPLGQVFSTTPSKALRASVVHSCNVAGDITTYTANGREVLPTDSTKTLILHDLHGSVAFLANKC